MATDIATLSATEARAALAKRENQVALLRDKLRAMTEGAQSIGGLAADGASIAGGALAAGVLDGAVLGEEGLRSSDALMRPSTLLGAAFFAGALAMGSPTLAKMAGGALAPSSYIQGCGLGIRARSSLTAAKEAAAAKVAA